MSAAAHNGISGFVTEPPQSGGRTLVSGTTFAVCGADGDMGGDGAQGLFVRDARVISKWRLTIDGHPVQPLGAFTPEPFAGVYLARSRARDGRAEPTLLVERRRRLGEGMVEDLVLHNYGREPAGVQVTVDLDADFADLFSVKVGRPAARSDVQVRVDADAWRARSEGGPVQRTVEVRASGAAVTVGGLAFRVVVPPSGTWRTSLSVAATLNGRTPRASRVAPGRRPESAHPGIAAALRRLAIHADSLALTATVSRSQKDLAALGLVDPEEPDNVLIAAGAPWFMALFGRDSLLTSAMSLPVNPELAVGSCRALARYQGRQVEALTEEQPGRILHELRFGVDVSLALGGADRYYGSVDATPLFVMVVGQLARWGAEREVVDGLLPAVDRALEWIERYGDRDGDGFVEYLRSTDRGLRNQGWKDSADGITFADGTIAEPPIALVEVQAYVYGAYHARSELASQRGETDEARYWADRASAFKRRFNDAFWLPDRGHYALGLDGEKRPIDALASNIGHTLWAGAAEPDKAFAVAERLVSPELFSGYGIRTLATTMGAYNPASYHNGSVWPHDTALAVAGLVRYGYTHHAQRVALGLIEAASYFSGRLPELFCGFDKTALPGPAPYPTSCSPQAWASAAPVAVLVAMLGLEPDVPARTMGLSPALPAEWGAVRVSGIALGPMTLDVDVGRDGRVSVTGAEGFQVADRALAEPT
jgi:glycogen debranching enzyme